MHRARSYALAILAITPLLVLGLALGPAAAQITFGSLSNFDVFNDTGQECHGFEIELGGVSSIDIVYTFGAPYERYGDPKLVDFIDANGVRGVYVRYESPYDPATGRFIERTVQAPSPVSPTDGHSCFNGGGITNYDTSGCEHFGIALNGNPTRTVYRWLVADPTTPGALQPSGTKVSIPAPLWNVAPAPDPAAPPVVQALIQAPAPEGFPFGEAQWVKVFKTESPDPVKLEDLVTDNPVVPQDAAEVEVEWVLLQAGGGGWDELAREAQVAAGNESVTRRYEFYRYTAAYDLETNEALCDNPIEPAQQTPDRCGAPDANGVAGVGEYIGAQMAALNLAPLPAKLGLWVDLTGGGRGAVTSAPAGIDCGAACVAAFVDGTAVTLSAVPGVDSVFVGWTGGGCAGTGDCALTLTADTLIAAAFELKPISLTVAKTGAGGGTVTSVPAGIDCGATCGASYASGTSVSLAAAAAAGSFFTGWSGGGCAGTGGCTVTLTAATAVTAGFHLLAQSADLGVSLAGSPSTGHAGRRIRYPVTTQNLGPAAATGTVLKVVLSGLQPGDLASIQAPRGCAVAGATVTCSLGTLKAGRGASTTVSVVPGAAGTVSVSATASAATPDPASANNTAVATTTVQ